MIQQGWKICTVTPTILVFKETKAIPATVARDCPEEQNSCSFLTLNPKALIKKPWGVRVSSTVHIGRKETHFGIMTGFLAASQLCTVCREKGPTLAEEKLPSQNWKWSSYCWIHGAAHHYFPKPGYNGRLMPDAILHIGTTLQNSSACKILFKRLPGWVV